MEMRTRKFGIRLTYNGADAAHEITADLLVFVLRRPGRIRFRFHYTKRRPGEMGRCLDSQDRRPH